jgi:hypothetical protein
MKRPGAFIGALLCLAGLVLELGLFLKHRLWGGTHVLLLCCSSRLPLIFTCCVEDKRFRSRPLP